MRVFPKVLLVTALSAWSCVALAAQKPSAPRPEYPYPGEPQYQYPRMDGVKEMKCPKGQQPYQGKCRITRRVY